MNHTCLQSETLEQSFMGLVGLFLLCSTRRTVRKSLLEEVQELEARAVDPGAAVLRDASGRRYIVCATKHHLISPAVIMSFVLFILGFFSSSYFLFITIA